MKEYIKYIWVALLLLVAGNAFPVTVETVRDTLNREYAGLPPYRLRTPDEKLMKSCREDAAFNYTRQKSEMPAWLQRIIDWIAKHLFGIKYKTNVNTN